MKNFYSVAKFLCSTTYDNYKLRDEIHSCPMPYGVWHAYKCSCEALHEK